MKTTLLFIVMMIVNATDEKFVQIMSKNIDQVYAAKTEEELQSAVNAFDRIANAEKSKWEPLYYSAFGNVMLAISEKDGSKKDKYLDLAFESIQKAKTIKPGESELLTMEGFIHTIRVTVDPNSRGQQYSNLAFEAYNKALALNPENPRTLTLLAQLEFGMAQFFNSPTTDACNTNRRALEKFSSQKTDNPLAPMWGKTVAEELSVQCEKATQK